MAQHPSRFRLHRLHLAVGIALATVSASPALASPALASPTQDPLPRSPHWGYWPATDTSNWNCASCPQDPVREREVMLGAGYANTTSTRLARYTGIDGGSQWLAGARLRQSDPNGRHMDLQAEDLGIDTRAIALRFGEYGRYRTELSYASIPGFVAEAPQTVFQGLGSSRLTLPDDWVRGHSTQAMPALEANLRPVRLDQRRDTVGVAATVFQGPSLEYALDYRRIEQDGFKRKSGSFLIYAAELPVPLDHVNDQIDAGVTYRAGDWTATASYHLSLFRNAVPAVTWDNPFTFGPEQGQMALEPDNYFQQFLLAASWRTLPQLTTAGRIAIGRMEQNARFLPTTVHPVLEGSPEPLPRDDLGGRVDTVHGTLRAVWVVGPRLTFTGEGYYDEHDNRTERLTYSQIATDSLLGNPRMNRPYSHARLGGKVIADMQISPANTVSAGGRAEQFTRTLQEVDKTETTSVWGEIRSQVTEKLDAKVRIARERRLLVDRYTTPADVAWVENPQMRKYHLADRDRDQWQMRLSYALSERVNLGVATEHARDDFPYSRVGLQEARERQHVIDLTTMPRENLTISAFLGQETVQSTLRGASSFAEPNWTASQKDHIDSLGLTLHVSDFLRKGFDFGADFLLSSGNGKIRMATSSPADELPDLQFRQQTLQTFGRYRVNDQFSVQVDYRHDRLRSRDYALDGVSATTLPELLSLGGESAHYSAQFIGTRLLYRF